MSKRTFVVTIRTTGQLTQYTVEMQSSADAFEQAVARAAGIPCGVTVIPAQVHA